MAHAFDLTHPNYHPDPRFAGLGGDYADPVAPADFPKSVIRFRNQAAAATVGLAGLSDPDWIAAFARFEPLPGNQAEPLAMRYHGHQFGVYNPQLGDGRGFLYAQLREAGTGRLLDLATKGSGRTPWSRSGDGRLTLKGGVREVLATAMLEAQGVPTSRSFSLIETGEPLQRNDEPSPTRSAVLTRLSHSHIRFGTFQRHAYLQRPDLIVRLIDHVGENYDASVLSVEGDGPRALAFLAGVTARAAHLAARWMAAGFVHGVLNTDNMNITGESFDYGPYRFLPRNDPNFVAAYFDQQGLYRFGRQPQAVLWNLKQLAGCLVGLADEADLADVLNGYAAIYRDALCTAIFARLGIKRSGEAHDLDMVNIVFQALAAGYESLRWEPLFFDWFGGQGSQARALAGPRRALYGLPEFVALRQGFERFEPDRPERLDHAYFTNPEPQALLIDEIEQIWAAIAQHDDWTPFMAKLYAIAQMRAALI
jgi:uncharacterized protein YdiU (UPF0061 family)